MVAWALKKARVFVVTVVGFTVLGIGVAMIVLPGPAVVVIPIGLGILATEFVWARRLLKEAKEKIVRLRVRKDGESGPGAGRWRFWQSRKPCAGFSEP